MQGRISYCRLMNFNQLNGRHLLELSSVLPFVQRMSLYIPLFGFDVYSQKSAGCEAQTKNNKDIKVSILLS